MAGDAETTGARAGGSGAGGDRDDKAARGNQGDHRLIPDTERLLTPAEVAAMFRVDPKTVTRWARDGRLTAVRTLGGHRRYLEAEVLALLRAAHAADAP
jgi:excisionase family DNA binding protein